MIAPSQIIECTDREAREWDDFMAIHPAASFYHLYHWKRINEDSLGHQTYYIGVRTSDRLTGVFPLVLVQSPFFGKILCSMPFVNYGGPCGINDDIRKQLVEAAVHIARRESANYAEFRGLEPLGNEYPSTLHKVSMTIELKPDPDILWNAFTSKHRTNIRRVYKNNLHVVSGHLELLDAFYQVLAECWRDHGTPIYRKRYFADILEAFPDSTRIYIVYRDQVPVAAAFNGHFRDTVEGMWAGTDPRYRNLQPSYVLYWEMIKDACQLGYVRYHLGRSTAESGGESFKKKWNAQSQQLYWQYYLPPARALPQLNVGNPRFRLAIQVWRRLPTRLTTLIGPYVARGIP